MNSFFQIFQPSKFEKVLDQKFRWHTHTQQRIFQDPRAYEFLKK
jgi:hypothetical protein